MQSANAKWEKALKLGDTLLTAGLSPKQIEAGRIRLLTEAVNELEAAPSDFGSVRMTDRLHRHTEALVRTLLSGFKPPAEARQHLQRAAEVLKVDTGENDWKHQAAKGALADELRRVGDTEAAVAWYRAWFESHRGTVHPDIWGRYQRRVVDYAETLLTRGDVGGALETAEVALGHLQNMNEEQAALAECFAVLGMAHRMGGEPELSLWRFDQAEELLDRAGFDLELRLASARALTYLDLDRLDDALRCLLVGGRLPLERASARALVSQLVATARYELCVGDDDGAQESCEFAIRTVESAYAGETYFFWVTPFAECRVLLAEVFLRQGRDDPASEHLGIAYRELVPAAGSSPAVIECRLALAELARRQGDLEVARDQLDHAVADAEVFRVRAGTAASREYVTSRLVEPYHRLVSLGFESGEAEDVRSAFVNAERSRARALHDALARSERVDRPKDAEEAELMRRDVDLTLAAAEAYGRLSRARELTESRDSESTVGLAIEESRIRHELEEVREALLMRRTDGNADGLEGYRAAGIDWEGLAALLQPGTLFVEYVVTRDECFSFWVDATGSGSMYRMALSEDELRGLVEESVAPQRSVRADDVRAQEARRVLAASLLAPLLEFTEMPPADHLLVVADSTLHYLPLELLPIPNAPTPQLVGERFAVSYAPSASFLARLQNQGRHEAANGEGPTLVAFGDPAFRQDDGTPPGPAAEALLRSAGRTLDPLPGTRAEVEGIAAQFGDEAQIFLGADATERQARRAVTGCRYIHFATHALIDDANPLYTGLALAPPKPDEPAGDGLDDFLHVYELFDLTLTADVVVCSACETGIGHIRRGEGVVGMSRALLSAGAHCVVLSLWPVPDESTAELMVSFYAALRVGDAPAHAMRKARLGARQRYSDPLDWAGFVVIGAAA